MWHDRVMDPITVTYYALVCAGLSLGAGRIRATVTRVAVGVLVGIAAAAALPTVRAALGV